MSPEEIENLKKQIAAGKKKLDEILELKSDVPASVFKELKAIYEQRVEILGGTYFGCTADFWTTEALPSGDDFNYEQEWKAFHRKYDPNHPEKLPSSYHKTIEKIKDNNGDIIPGYIPATPSSNSSMPQGSETSSINKEDACDIFGAKPHGRNKKAEKAHLLPFGPKDRRQWIGVAGAVLGLDPEEDNEQLLKATHGVKKDESRTKPAAAGKKRKPSDSSNDSGTHGVERKKDESDTKPAAEKEKNEKLLKTSLGVKRSPDSGKNNEDESDGKRPAEDKPETNNANNVSDNRSSASIMTKRVAGTGVVHCPENMIRLRNQKQEYDGDYPEVLIVPSLTLEKAREWKGGPYKAVVLVGLPYRAFQASYTCYEPKAAHLNIQSTNGDLVSKFLAMRNDREEPRILDTALKSLKETLLAVVGYVQSMVEKGSETIGEPLHTKFKDIEKKMEDKKIFLPTKRDDPNSKPLLYVKFGAQEYFKENESQTDTDTNSMGQDGAGTRENEGDLWHPAPDPLLLLVKAAVIWGRMTGVELIANGEEEDDDDSSGWEEDCPSHRADIPQEISVEIMSCAPEKTMKTKTMDFLLSV